MRAPHGGVGGPDGDERVDDFPRSSNGVLRGPSPRADATRQRRQQARRRVIIRAHSRASRALVRLQRPSHVLRGGCAVGGGGERRAVGPIGSLQTPGVLLQRRQRRLGRREILRARRRGDERVVRAHVRQDAPRAHRRHRLRRARVIASTSARVHERVKDAVVARPGVHRVAKRLSRRLQLTSLTRRADQTRVRVRVRGEAVSGVETEGSGGRGEVLGASARPEERGIHAGIRGEALGVAKREVHAGGAGVGARGEEFFVRGAAREGAREARGGWRVVFVVVSGGAAADPSAVGGRRQGVGSLAGRGAAGDVGGREGVDDGVDAGLEVAAGERGVERARDGARGVVLGGGRSARSGRGAPDGVAGPAATAAAGGAAAAAALLARALALAAVPRRARANLGVVSAAVARGGGPEAARYATRFAPGGVPLGAARRRGARLVVVDAGGATGVRHRARAHVASRGGCRARRATRRRRVARRARRGRGRPSRGARTTRRRADSHDRTTQRPTGRGRAPVSREDARAGAARASPTSKTRSPRRERDARRRRRRRGADARRHRQAPKVMCDCGPPKHHLYPLFVPFAMSLRNRHSPFRFDR